MGVTITQQPITPNAAYTRLPYVLSGSNINQPQFQYVLMVLEAGVGNPFSYTLTQTPNGAGVGVFDISKILQGELGEDESWKVTGSIAPINTVKEVLLLPGEQYGTSESSSVQIFYDIPTPIPRLTVFPAVVDPNNGVTFDFDTHSLDRDIFSNAPIGENWNALTTDPNFENINLVLGLDDYHTITLLDADTDITVGWWTKDETLIGTQVISSATVDYSSLGIGPANLIDLNSSNAAYFNTADYVAIDIVPTTSLGFRYRYAIKNGQLDPYCTNKYTRFAFINEYGFWDYYNIYNPVKKTSTIQRQNVTLPQVDFSSATSTYDVTRRGKKQYYTERNDSFTIDTDYISKPIADWLEELIESPSVYIQVGSEFIPVVITNSMYQHNNNEHRNKLFKYTIEFIPANKAYKGSIQNISE